MCVPTPLAEEGGPDLAPVRAAAAAIGRHVTPGTLCILESTTYPGTTEEVFAPLVCGERLEVGRDVFIAFSPERIDPGNEKFGVRNTPKVVGGLTAECTAAGREFYGQFIDTVVQAKGAREAEMAKLLENTFRHVNIALVNEMVRFCDELDIDLWDAIDCAETKPFGYMAFRPGPGVGGHCIPVDPSYLSHRVKAKLGYAFRLVELAEEINTAAPLYVATAAQGPAQRSQPSGQGIARAAPRSDLQGQHLGLPREPGRPAREAAARMGCRPRPTTTPTCRPGTRTASTRRWTRCPTSSRPCATPMSWCSCRPTPNMRSPSSPTRQRCCSTPAESSPGTPTSRCSEGWSGSDDLVDDGTRHVDRLEVPDHPIAAGLSQPLAQRGIAGE